MKPKKEMALSEWKEVLKDPIFKTIKELTVSGGEAFLFDDYVGAIELFIDSMPKLQRLVLNTNGFLSKKVETDVKKISKICQIKKVRLMVAISVDGPEKLHDEIRRTKGGYKRAMETAVKLKKISKAYDFKLMISTLLLKKNIDKYEEIESWHKKNEIDYGFQLIGFHDTFVNNLNDERKLGYESKKKTLLEVLHKLSRGGGINLMSYYWTDMKNMYENKADRTTPCSFLKDGFVVDSLGDVYYCLSVKPIGNFIKEKRSVGEIYFDKKNLDFRNRLPQKACKRCNSGCGVTSALAFDLKRFIWFKLTGRLWNSLD